MELKKTRKSSFIVLIVLRFLDYFLAFIAYFSDPKTFDRYFNLAQKDCRSTKHATSNGL